MDTTLEHLADEMPSLGKPPPVTLALVITWCVEEPERVGQIFLIDQGPTRLLGRGPDQPSDTLRRLLPLRQRPGALEGCGPLRIRHLSRRHLEVTASSPKRLELHNIGRAPMVVNGRQTDQVEVGPGDVVEIHHRLQLLCAIRPLHLPNNNALSAWACQPFGEPDPAGIVGEAPATWELRARILTVGQRGGHVLICGPSGSGKELVANALHQLSERSSGPLVARNAATLPEGLVDAELFGTCRNYPNAGMPERPGLIGQADGGTLYLDEIGELPSEQQAHLLRVLDAGEYQRLGDARLRRSDFRLIAATNRDPASLKHDFLARFDSVIEVPGLDERPEDVPLLAIHLLKLMRSEDPTLDRFFDGDRPRLAPALVRQLLQHRPTTHVRELRRMLWRAVDASEGPWIAPLTSPDEPPPLEARSHEADLTGAAVQAALDRANGVQEIAWRALGLSSRHQLRRLIKKHGLIVRRSG